MARFYTDEHVPLKVTQHLRELGHDVLTAQEAGKADQRTPDEDVLAYAIQQRRSVVSMNRRHFIRLHGEQPNHHGVIVCTLDPDFSGQAKRIHQAVEALNSLKGQLLRIYRPA